MFRADAALQTAQTNSGKRLSTRTASAPATNADASGGNASPSRSPRRVAIVFSPWPSSRINDTDAVAPATRTTPLQSMPSAESSAMMRVLMSSWLPPSGPAKRVSPPSRAMPTAALAAQPPPVTMKSEACTFVPGAGNFSTRMTMSCTAMPEHRIVGVLRLPSAKRNLVFHPGTNDVIRDCDRWRRRQAVRMLAHQHRLDFTFAEPPRILELAAVHNDLACLCLGVA